WRSRIGKSARIFATSSEEVGTLSMLLWKYYQKGRNFAQGMIWVGVEGRCPSTPGASRVVRYAAAMTVGPLGILGGGQLGRMTLQAASQLGIDVVIAERVAESPAARLTHWSVVFSS